MNETRIYSVAEAIVALGYDGIAAFDRAEPEYETLQTLYDRFDSAEHVKLLALCAATQDYQLNGDAQAFWRALDRTVREYETLDSAQTVRDVLGDFMAADVNARLNDQKRDRLIRLFENGFDEWFLDTHESAAPIEVWERLAADMETRKRAKTVVFAMKVYDIAHLVRHGEYLEFPSDIPIPCDLQVERVAQTAGLTERDDAETVMGGWAHVMETISARLGRHVSLLRIDSIVWQAGQIIGNHEPNRTSAREALVDHFEHVGIPADDADYLARELTAEM
ncbi:N-glycosylase/DNA lyase [Halorientalis sp. IM1011]|uniref:N-glycosylase/DNA lyase n=1 Tax=Halorientalis sp. IM1011 TaxID=1932360 RepID=UPI001C129B18|nr:N-glycosylase/DNA lyase [Halorientalis sp. IM1011]